MGAIGRACLLVALAGCGARTDLNVAGGDAASMDAGATTGRMDAGRVEVEDDAGAPVEDAGRSCAELTASFPREPPMLVLIIDRSGSMRALFRRWTPMFPSASRWEVVREILVGARGGEGIVHSTSARIGMSTYTTEAGECPFIRFVPPARGNAEALRVELESLAPAGGTPTAEALRDALARVPEHRRGDEPVSFLLATDGAPGACGPDGGETGVVAATREAFAEGVRTFVIGVGDETSAAHLQDVANAGIGATSGAEFWEGRSPAHLLEALEEATARAVNCYAELSAPITDLSRACEVGLWFDDERFSCGDVVDGYRFPDARHLELHGAACQALRDGRAMTLDAPCDLL